jgi:Flp pilus assembly protein TadG
MSRTKIKRGRSGATTAEFAIVAPVLFLVVFGTIELGRALMATQSLEEAARSGCRIAVLRGVTDEDVQAEVRRILGPSGISTYSVEVLPANLTTAPRWSPVSVTVTATYNDMSWLPLPRYFGGKTYSASCVLPKEYSPSGG